MNSTRACFLAVAAALLLAAALPARGDSIIATITLNTAGLSGGGPFELYFQLNDGSGSGDGNNALTLNNFDFGVDGSAGLVDGVNSSGDYSGSLGAGLALADSQAFNAVAAFFAPGSQLTFDLADTFSSVDSPIPDIFALAVINNGSIVSTTADDLSNSLIELNFDSSSPTPLIFADNSTGDTMGAPQVQVQVQTPATVPEPGTLLLVFTGLALLAFTVKWGSHDLDGRHLRLFRQPEP